MQRLTPQYQAIEDAVTSLLRIDRQDAEKTLARVQHLQSESLWILALAALLGIGLTVAVGVRVTRMVQATEVERQRQSARLQERNRDLDAFAGRVAHDLRGPLTTLTLAVGSLDHGTQPERARQLLDRGVQRMTALIDELLAFSRSEAAQAACNPAAAAAALREDMMQRLEQAGAQLTVEVEPAEVRCGEGLLRQALWNLVDNAVKYRRRGVRAEVEIRGRACDQLDYELSVRDNGMGMSPEEMRHAFEPRYRGKNIGGIDGTGLGLSLVKRVAEAAGGRVFVESELGRGTIFRLRLHHAM
jgi:signal transduction histidine kinase